MKRALLSAGLLAVIALGASTSAHAKPRPLFPAPPLSTFDGIRWGGLVLGQTTFKQIRSTYETSDGAYDHSTGLTQDKNSGLRINCLWTKRGDDEVLSAIAFRYGGITPSSEQLERSFDPDATQGQELYQRGRFEDWRLVRFPKRGVAAFQLRQGQEYATPLIVFSAPNSTSRLATILQTGEAPVEERVDPHVNEPKVAEFGDVSVTFSGRDSGDIPEWARRDLRSDLRDTSARGTLEWDRGSTGTYKMSVSSTRAKNNESGNFSVSTTIEASGPYGKIVATGSGSQRWKLNDDDYPRSPSQAFNRAVREARRDAESEFEKKMLASGPPTLESIRESQWSELVTILRLPQNGATGGGVAGF